MLLKILRLVVDPESFEGFSEHGFPEHEEEFQGIGKTLE